jgi:hypothetical protein
MQHPRKQPPSYLLLWGPQISPSNRKLSPAEINWLFPLCLQVLIQKVHSVQEICYYYLSEHLQTLVLNNIKVQKDDYLNTYMRKKWRRGYPCSHIGKKCLTWKLFLYHVRNGLLLYTCWITQCSSTKHRRQIIITHKTVNC